MGYCEHSMCVMMATVGRNMYMQIHGMSIPRLCQLCKNKQIINISKVGKILLSMFLKARWHLNQELFIYFMSIDHYTWYKTGHILIISDYTINII
jgi:hypothetical protein